ncbi:MAG TPA: vWA domain-containing protein [Candidatus Thermoplasmatota archaeon]|nr:vWA domain-containing protein [Candidatus Thermoplasmatota archaeon]
MRVDPEPGSAATRDTRIEVQPQARARGGPTLDVVVLLDASESMGAAWSAQHTRWTAACEAARAFLRAPGSNLRLVSIMIFAREAQLVAGPLASHKVQLPELVPRGRAMTGTAVNAALAHLCQHATPASPQAIVLLTDAAGEVAELRRAAERAARLRVAVHALVFAPEPDGALAEAARATGGTSQVATSPPSFTLRYAPPEATS